MEAGITPVFDRPALANEYPSIGGGPDYDRTVLQIQSDHPFGSPLTREHADVVVEAGDVPPESPTGDQIIWFGGSDPIDLTGVRRHYKGVKILASGRENAPTLIVDDHPTPVFRLDGDGSRITGTVVDGPDGDNFDTDGADYAAGNDAMFASINGANCEVDNNVFRGWTYAAVEFGRHSYPNWAHVHHNTVVDCNCKGLGYGFCVVTGQIRFWRNYFDNNRHHLASWRRKDGKAGYTALENIGGPHARLHAFDFHGPKPRRVGFIRNLVMSTHNTYDESGPSDIGQEALYIRGVPDRGGLIKDNWFFHEKAPPQPFDDAANGPVLVNNAPTFEEAGITYEANAHGRQATGGGPSTTAQEPPADEPTEPTDGSADDSTGTDGLTEAQVTAACERAIRNVFGSLEE